MPFEECGVWWGLRPRTWHQVAGIDSPIARLASHVADGGPRFGVSIPFAAERLDMPELLPVGQFAFAQIVKKFSDRLMKMPSEAKQKY